MAPTFLELSNELVLPLGTKYKITYSSKANPGLTKKAIICPGPPDENVFYALFEEDDVDWKLITDNKSCSDRDVRTGLTIRDDGKCHTFITKKAKTGYVETLESNGRKFHFAKSSSRDGQAMIGAAARDREIDRSEAKVLMSRVKMTVVYGWTEVELKSKEIQEIKRNEELKSNEIERIKELKSKPLQIEVVKKNILGKKNKGTSRTFNVTGFTTLSDLKKLVEVEFDAMPEEQHLFYQEELKTENKCLYDYQIKDGATLDLFVSPKDLKPQATFFFIRLWTGKVITMEAMSSDKVENIRGKIEEKEGTDAALQRLIFWGQELEDGRELAWYGIERDCEVKGSFRLRGGGHPCYQVQDESGESGNEGSEEDSEYDEEMEIEAKPGVGERGVICFGEKSTQTFGWAQFTRRFDIDPENFTIELRMVS